KNSQPFQHSRCLNCMNLSACIVIYLLLIASLAPAQLLKTVEAENCQIVHGAKTPLKPTQQFASGYSMAPEQWGGKKGDTISWKEDFTAPARHVRLGVRYAADAAGIKQRHGSAPESFTLLIDDARIPVVLKTTGHWLNFETAFIDLPEIPPGSHEFSLRAEADHSDRNIDCFYFILGDEKKLPIALLNTIVARSADKRFEVWSAPETNLPYSPEYMMDSCARIYDYLKEQTGISDPTQRIAIHVRPHKYVGGHQFQNAEGIWFSDDPASCSPGGWCHEINHFFTPNVHGWMGHPFIRINDGFVTPQKLFPEYARITVLPSADNIRRHKIANDFLSGKTYRTQDPHVVAYALYLKYGEKIVSDFFHATQADIKSGKLKLPESKMIPPRVLVQYLSQAAGENVEPYFLRLDGYPDDVERRYTGI
ncbi:MAG: hypothetical protein ABI579_03490, partial [Candidatus Sumerlaeota bacterium]